MQVLVTERQQPPDTRAPYAVANVVAARDGVLTEVSVTEGMRLCAVGDTVRQGQLLVSGYEDYGLFIRRCAPRPRSMPGRGIRDRCHARGAAGKALYRPGMEAGHAHRREKKNKIMGKQ